MVSNYIKQDSLSIDGFRSICITIVFNDDDDDDDGHADGVRRKYLRRFYL